MARFPNVFCNTFCSQCGRDFGPGDHGFSDCASHRRIAADRVKRKFVAEREELILSRRAEFSAAIDGMTQDRRANLDEILRQIACDHNLAAHALQSAVLLTRLQTALLAEVSRLAEFDWARSQVYGEAYRSAFDAEG